jgi:hypothetical protein
VVNVAALVTVDKDDLDELIGQVPDYLMQNVDRGLRQVLGVGQRHWERKDRAVRVMTARFQVAGPDTYWYRWAEV